MFLFFCLSGGTGSGREMDWNQFRGPNGSGVLDGCLPPVELDELGIEWESDVPLGFSSPVVCGRVIVVTGIEAGRLVTEAFSIEDGSLIWRRHAPEVKLAKSHEAHNGASSTPVIGAGSVSVYFSSYGLIQYDLEGNEKWKVPLGVPESLYGAATSPVLHNGNVILVLDDDRDLEGSSLSRSRVVAFDQMTGIETWSTARPYNRSNWSTPMIWRHSKNEELVVLGNGRVYGYDPETGGEKWYVDGFTRETIAVPVSEGDTLYVSASMQGGGGDDDFDGEPFWKAVLNFDVDSDGRIEASEISDNFTIPIRPELPPGHPGFGIPLPKEAAARKKRQRDLFNWRDRDGNGIWTREEFLDDMRIGRGRPNLAAIRSGGRGDISKTHVLWNVRKGIPEIPSPLVYRGVVYLLRDGGILTAVDAGKGDILYSERLGAPGHYAASPVAADGHVYLMGRRGVISVIKAGKEFEIVSQLETGAEVHATPALAQGRILIRGKNKLFSISKRKNQ